jgi:antitoxin component YwqK of YwqJK toxin-antitoxin module
MKNLLLIVFFLSVTSLFSQNESDTINPDGLTVFHYENGQISSIGTMRNGKPDGYWKTFYENGVVKSEGNRLNFELDSIWTFYNDTGKVVLQITYKNGKKNGIRRTYQEDEVMEENFVDDVKQGFTNYFYPNGKLKKEVPFVDGLEEGLGKMFAADDGRVIELIHYRKGYIEEIENINRIDKNGYKQGKWVWFYPDGKIKKEGFYKNDLENGYFKDYDEEGNLISTSKYVDGVLQEDVAELAKLDIKTEYYPNGKVKIMASYKDDVPEGVRREYDEEGNIVKGYLFHNGKVVGEGITDEEGLRDGPWKEYYPNGAIKSVGTYDKGKRVGEWKFYHPDGQLEQIGSYNKDGKLDGTWTWYYADGQLEREESYFNGMLDGHSIEYDELGNVIAEGDYIEDYRDGKWVFNYGDHREEGEYLDGMRHGLWKSYYNNGQLSFEGEFIEDNPNGHHVWYWPNGNKKKEGNYSMGLKDGEWTKYNYDGTPFISINYENGIEKRYDGVRIRIYDDDEGELPDDE